MAKAIIDVQINDGPWKTFNAHVRAHQKALNGMPGQWGNVGKAASKTTGAAAKYLATIKSTGAAFKKAHSFAAKMTLSLKLADRVGSNLAKNTFKIARNLAGATKSLFRWSGILGLASGLLGAGGLFGITRMASNISSGQSSAMRSGSTYGGSKAAGISYGQLLGGEGGVNSLLEKIAREKESGGVAFRRVGMDQGQWQGKNASDILGPFLKAIQSAYKNAPKGAEAKAMEALAPDLDFNTIKQLSETNLSALEVFYEEKKKELELSKGTQTAYANFERSLDSAGEKLQNLFAKGIGPLLPALNKFTDGLLKAVGIVLKSPAVKSLIGGAGSLLTKGANYLTSDGFSDDFRSFMEELRKIAAAMQTTAEFLNKWLGSGDQERQEDEAVASLVGRFSGGSKSLDPSFTRQPQLKMPMMSFGHDIKINLMDGAGNNVPFQSFAAGSGAR